jgi:hypothetical protein
MQEGAMIEDFGLHDATLVDVHLQWAEGRCTMTLRHSELSSCRLTFTSVTNLSLSRAKPWGPSQSINAAYQRNPGQYEIEMQSGDLIKIVAIEVALTTAPVGS